MTDRQYNQNPGTRHVRTCPYCSQKTFVTFKALHEWRCYSCGAQGTITTYAGGGQVTYERDDLPLDTYPEPLCG